MGFCPLGAGPSLISAEPLVWTQLGASVWTDVEGQTGDCGCRISITAEGAEAPVGHLRCDHPPPPTPPPPSPPVSIYILFSRG